MLPFALLFATEINFKSNPETLDAEVKPLCSQDTERKRVHAHAYERTPNACAPCRQGVNFMVILQSDDVPS
jgi:hypothetical protein